MYRRTLLSLMYIIIIITTTVSVLVTDITEKTCPKYMHCINYNCSEISNSPYGNLNISYSLVGPRGLHRHLLGIQCGQPLNIHLAAHHPFIHLKTAKSHALYTITMIDPDVPTASNPKYAQWKHWLLMNVPGDQLINGGALDGDHLTHYRGPGPLRGSGWHRYIIFVFEQLHHITNINPNDPQIKRRARFDIHSFAKQYHLQLVSSNMFRSRQVGRHVIINN